MTISKRYNQVNSYSYIQMPPRYHLATGHLLPLRSIGSTRHSKFNNAVTEVSRNLKVSPDMALMVALAAVALCCQGYAEVEKPRGGTSPLSLLIIVLAESGSRKSPLVKVFFEHLRTLQSDLIKQYDTEFESYENDVVVWEQIDKGICAVIRKCAREGESTDLAEMQRKDHLKKRPLRPIKPKFIYEDITGPGLWKALRYQMKSVGVITSEASASLEKWMRQDLCHFNTAHDGGVIDIERAGDGSFELPATLTFLLMLQPELFDKHMQGRGQDLRSLGTFARYMFCRPVSFAGGRFDDGSTQSWEHIQPFKKRQLELMQLSCQRLVEGTDKDIVRFDSKATKLWVDISNHIEGEQQSGGYFEGISDHASKLMDLISRVAACLHVFEGYKGDISEETLEFAKELCYYSADYYNSQFVRPPQEIRDAITLNEYLNRVYRAKREVYVLKNDVRNAAPGKELRKKQRFDLAYLELCQAGAIREMRAYNNGRKEKVWIVLSPQEFTVAPQGYYFPVF